MNVVVLGLSITSSWGNGHATNYRALARELDARGHDVLFLERDVPWYAVHRDLPEPPYGRTRLYATLDELREAHRAEVADADLVVVGSYVPEGATVAAWALDTARGRVAFYDIDTPITVRDLEAGSCAYLSPELVPRFDLYLSFTGGPMLERLERGLGARRAVAFHCFVDAGEHKPVETAERWAAGYLGTYGPDRQDALERLLVDPARARPDVAFVVAGPQYPDVLEWPANVERIDHVPPRQHAAFYAAQRLAVSVTRADMRRVGWSPSVRLFEAAACGVPVVSDWWPGLEDFFRPGREILVEDTLSHLDRSPDELAEIGLRARSRVLGEHTAAHRADVLEAFAREEGVAA